MDPPEVKEGEGDWAGSRNVLLMLMNEYTLHASVCV